MNDFENYKRLKKQEIFYPGSTKKYRRAGAIGLLCNFASIVILKLFLYYYNGTPILDLNDYSAPYIAMPDGRDIFFWIAAIITFFSFIVPYLVFSLREIVFRDENEKPRILRKYRQDLKSGAMTIDDIDKIIEQNDAQRQIEEEKLNRVPSTWETFFVCLMCTFVLMAMLISTLWLQTLIRNTYYSALGYNECSVNHHHKSKEYKILFAQTPELCASFSQSNISLEAFMQKQKSP